QRCDAMSANVNGASASKEPPPRLRSVARSPEPASCRANPFVHQGFGSTLGQNFDSISANGVSTAGPIIEHSLGAPILGPARDIVAHGNRPLLAERDGADALPVDAVLGEIIANRRRAA